VILIGPRQLRAAREQFARQARGTMGTADSRGDGTRFTESDGRIG